MAKILITLENIEQLKLDCDGFIIGIKDLSVNMPNYFDIDILSKLDYSKDIFICLNKNMHNSDLEYLKEVLLKLNNYKIKGVIYYDISIVNMKDLLNYDLVWSQEHMTTNYLTSNFWFENGVKYTMISNDITLNEIKEIIKNSKAKLMITLFGYITIFTSKRKLIDNYLNYFKIDDNSKINYLNKEGKTYPIINDKNGTNVYTNYILNGLRESIDLDLEYIIINSFMIENIKEIINIFKNVNKENIDELESKINSLIKTEKGFLYEETVYRVKK